MNRNTSKTLATVLVFAFTLIPLATSANGVEYCTVTYKSNYGEPDEIRSYQYNPNDPNQPLPLDFDYRNWSQRDGYQFVGWNTAANGSGDYYEYFDYYLCTGSLDAQTPPHRQDILWAQWVPLESLYRVWDQTLAATGSLAIGQTVYASAFERILDARLVTPQSGEVDEYVYRITTAPNNAATSVDLQGLSGYSSLTADEQNNWYEHDLGYQNAEDYQFEWVTFLCYDPSDSNVEPTKPSQLKRNYLSMEDGLIGSGTDFGWAHRNRLRDIIYGFVYSPLRTVVGDLNGNFSQTPGRFIMEGNDPFPVAVGVSEVTADCGNLALGAFRLVDLQDAPITSKDFEIPGELRFEFFGGTATITSQDSFIGVTGQQVIMNAALWGLTKVGEVQGSTSGLAQFAGPTIKSVAPKQLINQKSGQVTIKGERLNQIESIKILDLSIEFKLMASGEILLNVPALKPGTYDLVITYNQGSRLIYQSAFKVATQLAQSSKLEVGPFAGDSYQLTQALTRKISSFIATTGENSVFKCTGSTSGRRVTVGDARLARQRADQVCRFVKKLKPSASIQVATNPSKGLGAKYRSAVIEIVDK